MEKRDVYDFMRFFVLPERVWKLISNIILREKT